METPTKWLVRANFKDGTVLEGSLTHHKTINQENQTHKYSIDLGEWKQFFVLPFSYMVIHRYLVNGYKKNHSSCPKSLDYIEIGHEITTPTS